MVYANQENHTVSSWPLNYVDFTCRIKNGKRSPVVLWIYYAVGYKEKNDDDDDYTEKCSVSIYV